MLLTWTFTWATFYVKTLRFIDIQHFPWHFWRFGSYPDRKMLDIYKSKSFSKKQFKYTFKSLKFPREWDKNQVFGISGFHYMKEKLRFFAKNCYFSKLQPRYGTGYYCTIKMKLCLNCSKFNLVYKCIEWSLSSMCSFMVKMGNNRKKCVFCGHSKVIRMAVFWIPTKYWTTFAFFLIDA